jgi:hypothetical protein
MSTGAGGATPAGDGAAPNRYRAGLVSAAARLAAVEPGVVAAFDAAAATMRAGVWEGAVASDWYRELQATRSAAARAVRQVWETCRTAVAAQPDAVAHDDWRARWAPAANGG